MDEKKFPFTIDASDWHLIDEDLLYQNDWVKPFLLSKSSSCISSAKGFGKTFLLKVKRKRIEERKRVEEGYSIHCIPKSQMLDTIPENIQWGKNLQNILSKYNNWVLLWKLSISLAVVKFECGKNVKYKKDVFETLEPVLCDILEQKFCDTPCEILKKILSSEMKKLVVILKNTSTIMNIVKRIQLSYAIFIDNVDEKMGLFLFDADNPYRNTDTNINIWYYSQYSILQVMHDFKQVEGHIDIYCGIRQEVVKEHLRCSATGLHFQLSRFITEIKYSYNDLEKMFVLYVDNSDESYLVQNCEENKITAFFGEEIKNLHTYNELEEPFHYVYRHSLKRPRDIMAICVACKENSIRKNINKFRDTVNTKAIDIAETYLSNIEPFIVDEFNKYDIKSFITNDLSTNVFRKEDLIEICSKYNKIYDASECSKDECERCKKLHPFCTLYNVGLLGYIQDNEGIVGVKEQYFLPPGHSLHTAKSALPKSDIYFLHPSINDWLKDKNNSQSFNACKSFVVGDSKPITNDQICNAITEIEQYKKTIQLNISDTKFHKIKSCVKKIFCIMLQKKWSLFSRNKLSCKNDIEINKKNETKDVLV